MSDRNERVLRRAMAFISDKLRNGGDNLLDDILLEIGNDDVVSAAVFEKYGMPWVIALTRRNLVMCSESSSKTLELRKITEVKFGFLGLRISHDSGGYSTDTEVFANGYAHNDNGVVNFVGDLQHAI